MPHYSYVAKSPTGETKKGKMAAKNTRELAKKLRDQELLLIDAFTEGEEKKRKKINISIPFLGKVSLKEKLMLTRNLKVMIASGLPLSKSLDVLSQQTENKKLEDILSDIKAQISEGKSFSESLGKYPDVFSELYRNMVKAGEEGGMMEEVLQTLALQMEKEHQLKSKIKGAMIYPAVVISAMVGVGITMIVLVVPRISSLFEQLGLDLPLTTRIVIYIGTTLTEKWYYIVPGIIVFIIIFWRIIKTKPGKRLLDKFLLKIPIISSIIKQTNAATTARTLASLVSSGVPMVNSLQIIAGTLGNVYFKNALTESSEKIKKGARLSEALEPHKIIFPAGLVEMIRVGEETGKTSTILFELAEFFEDEVARTTKSLVSVLEPILMLVVGAAVGLFAISMIQPMYSMLGSV